MAEVTVTNAGQPELALVRLEDALDSARYGHKAATLAELRRGGHNVPDGFVIPAGMAWERRDLLAPLAALGRGPYSVRSSGVAEDLASASFAGQYESVIGVSSIDDVVTAASRVLASAKTARVAAYRADIDASDGRLAVLVQLLVAAEAAGVMFTKNPVTGDDEVVLEAVRGLGDRLVDGGEEAERWIERGGELEAPGVPSVLREHAGIDPPRIVGNRAPAREARGVAGRDQHRVPGTRRDGGGARGHARRRECDRPRESPPGGGGLGRAHPGPLVHGPAPVPPPSLRGFPAACRRLMNAALWAMNEELGPPTAKHTDDGALCGVAVSPGHYTGPVRVIRTEAELCELERGEVLVCPTTHSSWTVAFSKVGALVADGGSILSHPSIIAREHGIPAVVGTVSGTRSLNNGDLVTVDGNTGRVVRA